MTSVFNTLLIELQARITTALPDTPAIPGIRYVEQDLGQIDVYETKPAVPDTGVLVDYISTNYVQRQLKAQWAEMNINLKLYMFNASSSNSLAPLATKEKALFYYELESKLYLILQDWTANGLLMLPMKRVSSGSEKRDDGIRVRNIVFKATYEDRTLNNGGIIVPPINPVAFRIDFNTAVAGNSVQDDRLKGKTVAHILEVSWEGDDKFEPIAIGDPTADQVKLDHVAGTLTFLNDYVAGDAIWAMVLTS